MSFEGYRQNICETGHKFTSHIPFEENDETMCPHCKGPSVWYNIVDDTNCDAFGLIDMNVLQVKKATTEKCNLGHLHEIKPAIYRVPSPEETKKLRTRYEWGTDSRVPIQA